MIQEFTIANTLSIKTPQTISFEATRDESDRHVHYITVGSVKLLKLAAIFGGNASGKSNMLKALDFYIVFILNAFSDLKPKERTGFRPFAFDPDTREAPGSFAITFYSDGVKHDYQLTLDKKCVHEEKLTYSPKGQKKLIFHRTCVDCSGDCDSLSYKWKWGDTLLGSKSKIAEMTRQNTTFLNTAAQLEHPDLGKLYDSLRKFFLPIITPKTSGLMPFTMQRIEKSEAIKNDILAFLEKADFGHINDIIIKSKEIPASVLDGLPDEARKELKTGDGKYIIKDLILSHRYGKDYPLSISRESAGTQRIVELAGPLLEIIKGRHFICIDELESSLHQELLEFILKTFLENSSESQILFTTHNLDLLDTEFLLDDEIWFSEKDEIGGSNYKGFVEYTGVRKGASRKKLYNAGKFGAKPIISNFIAE